MNHSARKVDLERQKMVEDQLKGRDIKDKRVLDVFNRVQRHLFIEERLRDKAYGDFPLPIGKGQTISQPYMVALMVQLLEIEEDDKVLEIGTGSGYETAVLAELSKEVYSIERIEDIAEKAKRKLEEFGYANIYIRTGDGTLGWQEKAPFNKIVVTASSPKAPPPLLDQLADRGRMVIPIGSRFSQSIRIFEKSEKGEVSEMVHCGCVFVPLIGRYAWEGYDAGKDA